jgi:Molybdopterin-binding domain of aldehyde dehydrogenase
VLLERSAYDQDGNYQSATFMDYLLPTACDIPRIEIEHLQTVPLDADVNFRPARALHEAAAPLERLVHLVCGRLARAELLPEQEFLDLPGSSEREGVGEHPVARCLVGG